MAKVLITDFFGTLIPEDLTQAMRLYSSGSKNYQLYDCLNDYKENESEVLSRMFHHIGRKLKDFLKEGNNLVIVTSADIHDNLKHTNNNLISRLYENIKEYSDRICLFYVTTGGSNHSYFEELKEMFKIENKENYYYISGNYFRTFLIASKPNVMSILKEKYSFENDSFFCIGNSANDLSMLLSVIDLGGQSSIINNDLYRQTLTTEDIIRSNVSLKIEQMIESIVTEFYPNFNQLDESQRSELNFMIWEELEKKHYKRWLYIETQKMYKSLQNNEIDINELFMRKKVYEFIQRASHCLSQEDGFISLNNIEKLNMYATFEDYYNKVLCK